MYNIFLLLLLDLEFFEKPTVHKHVVLISENDHTRCTDLFFESLDRWGLSIAFFGLAEYFIIDRSTTEHGIVATGIPRLTVGVLLVVAAAAVVRFVVVVIVVLLDNIDLTHKLGTEFEEDAFAVGTPSILFLLFVQCRNSIVYF